MKSEEVNTTGTKLTKLKDFQTNSLALKNNINTPNSNLKLLKIVKTLKMMTNSLESK